MNKAEVEEFARSMGLQSYRGRQIFRWIYQVGISDFELMTDLSKDLRAELSRKAIIEEICLRQRFHSKDGSTKFLFGLGDGLCIESVLIPEPRRLTLCISSQAGCPVGCHFCATGRIGFSRNLTCGEIVDQYIQVQRHSPQRISNVVFMGMGEPMLNLENVLKACQILTDDHGPSISSKKITISTVGIVRGMKRFSKLAGNLGLAVSLHSADEKTRRKIIPVACQNSLRQIIAEAKRYTELASRRVTFEYLLLGGLNDSLIDARKLAKLIEGIPCKINLILYNHVNGLEFERPSENAVAAFRDYLYPRTYAVSIRESRGLDIRGACGQLAAQSST